MAAASTFRAALVLGAGASRRMGSPKALLPWRDSTLLADAVHQARLAGVAEVVVVIGAPLQGVVVDATIVVNSDPDTGRSASIRLGATALKAVPRAVVVQSVDQPVKADILERLFEAVEAGAEVASPSFGGRRGHPVCLSGTLVSELRRVREETQGLRAVVRAHPVTEVPVEDESVVWNLNDPGAYAAARDRA